MVRTKEFQIRRDWGGGGRAQNKQVSRPGEKNVCVVKQRRTEMLMVE